MPQGARTSGVTIETAVARQQLEGGGGPPPRLSVDGAGRANFKGRNRSAPCGPRRQSQAPQHMPQVPPPPSQIGASAPCRAGAAISESFCVSVSLPQDGQAGTSEERTSVSNSWSQCLQAKP
jgi:hypothetical protein